MILKNVRHALRLALTNLRVAARWDVLLEKGVTFKYAETVSFGSHCTVQSSVYVYGSRSGKRVELAHHVVLAAGCVVLGEGGLHIGPYTHLGPGVVLTTQYGDSTTEMMRESVQLKTRAVRVGAGCWVGSRSVLMPGVVLGDRCIVAPGSVVFGEWPDDTTLSGNPARRVRRPGGEREAA